MPLRPLYVVRRRRRSSGPFVAGAVLIVLLGGAGYGALNLFNQGPEQPPTTTASSGSSMPAIPFLPTARPTATPIPIVGGTIADAYSGKPVAGATVMLGGEPLLVSAEGAFRFQQPQGAKELRVSAPSYDVVTQTVDPATTGSLRVTLRPTHLAGAVRGNAGQPLPGATVRVGDAIATTGRDGRYEFQNVPANAELVVDAPDHARHKEPVGKRVTLDVALRPSTLTGQVRAADGKPIEKATVALGQRTTITGADGRFQLTDVTEDGRLAVKASGHKAERRAVRAGDSVDVTLSPLIVKAIYLSPASMASDERFNELLALVKRTELNAMVIDVKDEDGHLHYASKLPLAQEIKASVSVYDVKKRLAQLREANVYAIARVVIMEDTLLSTARPEWAIKHKATGKQWRDVNNIGWMNPYRTEVWDYNAGVAREIAELGFDEIQFDYVRFPSDGALSQTDYGQPSNEETRVTAIASLLQRAKRELDPLGVYFSADIFGLTTVAADDIGIGQRIDAIADAVDYICPMVYPSHYAKGSFGLSNPAGQPYLVVGKSMVGGHERLGQGIAHQRPWLQDFDLYGTAYTPAMVREQIKASEEQNTSGWLLWNAANRYQEAALRKEN